MPCPSVRRALVTFAATALAGSATAAPVTIDLTAIADPSGNNYVTNYYPTNPGGSTYVDPATGVVIQGYYRQTGNGNAWTTNGANLLVRAQTNDRGLGVCNANETAECGVGVGGGGQFSELDNGDGYDELIRLTLPAGYRWVGFGMSSLDHNDDPTGPPERGNLWRSASGTPGLVSGTNIGDGSPFAVGFDLNGPTLEPSFLVPAGFQFSQYLFFEAHDWAGLSRNNDYLLHLITVERDVVPPNAEAPEPGTLGLLGAGLVALRTWRRRSR